MKEDEKKSNKKSDDESDAKEEEETMQEDVLQLTANVDEDMELNKTVDAKVDKVSCEDGAI